MLSGRKFFNGSNGGLGCSNELITWLLLDPNSSVYPSAGALATKLVPMMPVAPGLFSTMKGCPNASCSLSATMRA